MKYCELPAFPVSHTTQVGHTGSFGQIKPDTVLRGQSDENFQLFIIIFVMTYKIVILELNVRSSECTVSKMHLIYFYV